MKRDIEEHLLSWKSRKNHLPLLIRGARQVGKTFVIERFGKENFEHCVSINFEKNPEFSSCFNTLEPTQIIASIELLKNTQIKPGKTLLFLDEIQECPQAILALRYFKEELPDLHVIGAGSLLEFTLNDPNFRMPVGRVQFLYLRPLSFGEFLNATGHDQLRSYFRSVKLGNTILGAVHEKALSLVKEYFALGGMPAVIAEYIESKSLLQCQELQNALLATFRRDFGKYAQRMPHAHLQMIFAKAPGLVGKWLKYSSIDPDTSTVTLRNALNKLCDAGLLTLIYATSGSGLPLISHLNEKKCKFLFLDVGLAKRACNLDLELQFKDRPFLINQGALAEQFVGQELLATLNHQDGNTLFTWMREEKSSSAEIDFLTVIEGQMTPIEVKAGAIGSLRSLKIFLEEKKVPFGIRISELPLSFNNQVLSIPFYLIEQLPRLTKSLQGVGMTRGIKA